MIQFIVVKDGKEISSVETETTDDFYYFRDSVHDGLEEGDFGSRFPTLMLRIEPDEWQPEEVQELERELREIASEFRKLPPKPFDPNWSAKASRGRYKDLSEVFVDAGKHPLLGRLIELCELARREGVGIRLE